MQYLSWRLYDSDAVSSARWPASTASEGDKRRSSLKRRFKIHQLRPQEGRTDPAHQLKLFHDDRGELETGECAPDNRASSSAACLSSRRQWTVKRAHTREQSSPPSGPDSPAAAAVAAAAAAAHIQLVPCQTSSVLPARGSSVEGHLSTRVSHAASINHVKVTKITAVWGSVWACRPICFICRLQLLQMGNSNLYYDIYWVPLWLALLWS